MKAIYSFSSIPFRDSTGERFTGGFSDYGKFVDCARNSIKGARLTFHNIELYADKEGLEILKPLSGLFDKIIEIEAEPMFPHFFAYSKFLAYAKQDSPFLHIDFDLVLKEKIPSGFLNSRVIVEFPEYYPFYREIGYRYLQEAKSPFEYIKKAYSKGLDNPFAYCTGVFGGTDLDLINRYTKDVSQLTMILHSLDISDDLKSSLWLEQGVIRLLLNEFRIKPALMYYAGVDYIHYIGNRKFNY